jgi:type IV pilus assembly protein PilM
MELIKTNDKYRIGSFGETDIPLGVIEGGELKNPDAFLKILIDLKAKWHLTNVFISLPDDHAYTINLKLPSLKPEEIYGSIELQIEEYVSLPALDVVFDFEVIPQEEEISNLDVGVMAFPRKIVESYQDVFAKAGLPLLAIETQGGALARALCEKEKNSNLAIVDLGKNHTAIFWVRRGVVIHASAALVGGSSITRNLQKGLNVSFEEAEKIKMSQGLLRSESNQSAFEAIIPVVSAIREEIERLLSFWLNQEGEGGPKLDQILLTGGQASLPGFVEYLGNHVSCPVTIGNPWGKIFPAGSVIKELSYNESLRYVSAIGLALRNFRQ